MACGDIAWWRAPDVVGLLQRHGQAEHLVIQFDFVSQAQRAPRAEFSIAGASKSKNGGTGYADVVAMATSEIWEIKPESQAAKAPGEVAWYLKSAAAACGPGWKAGRSYTTRDGTGVVYRIEGGGVRAELVAEQRDAGVIVYYWKLNGKKQTSLDPFIAISLRQAIVGTYFPSGLVPLPNARPAPDDVPPGKWKPPVLSPGSVVPALQRIPGVERFTAAVLQMARSTQAAQLLDGGAVAVILDTAVFDQIVGPSIVARQTGLMQVRSDPTVALYRQTLLALTAVGAGGQGAIAAAIGGYWLAGLAWQFGGAIAVETVRRNAPAAGVQPIKATSPLIETFLSAAQGSPIAGTAAADGASVLMFAVPHGTPDAPSTPVSVSVSVPVCRVLTPLEAQRVSPGQQVSEGVVVAVLGTGAD